MTYQRSSRDNPINPESGVALLLSVLVLSAITAIAFSLATIVFIELRASRDVIKSEPALYATLGVTEEALFQYKRFVPDDVLDVTNCEPKGGEICNLNGVEMNSPGPELLTEDDTPRLETVYAGETKTIPLFYLVNPPACDITCSWTPPFGEIEMELVPLGSTGTLTATAYWIAQDGTDGSETAASLTESNGRQSYTNFFPNRQYELRLTNPNSTNMQVAIWSYAPNGGNRGLPFIARRVLKIVADYSGLTRTYRVEIPVGSSALSSSEPNANDVMWVDDSTPAGAVVTGDEPWDWISSGPAPYSGSLAHRSSIGSGTHQHFFYDATATMSVAAGENLFAYVYLDPLNPPSQVMLQWNNGSWEHRAYWGSNFIGWGIDGTESRRYMGPLPATGQWIRLEVPASQVGLVGSTLNGMAFTLYGGRATWDAAGKEQP